MSEYIEVREGKKGTTYKVSIPYEHLGERKKYSKSFPSWVYGSKKSALKEATVHRDLMKAKLLNHDIVNTDYTLSDVYELKKKTFHHSYKTNIRHDRIMKLYVYPNIPPQTKFSSITYLDITNILNKNRSKLTQEYLSRIVTVFRQLYISAIRNDIVSVNQVDKVIIPRSLKVSKPKKQLATINDVKDFITRLDSLKNRELAHILELLVWVIYYEGLRPAEALALNKEDFDLENMTLTISKELRADDNGKIIVSVPKTERSARVLPLDDRLVDLIKNEPHGALFKLNGKYIDIDRISMIIHTIKKDFHLYQLRKAFATDLVKTSDLGTVQDLMGHNSPAMTLHYVKRNFDDMRQALKGRKE